LEHILGTRTADPRPIGITCTASGGGRHTAALHADAPETTPANRFRA